MNWTTDLPTSEGRYFIRPAGSTHQGKVVTVTNFGGYGLVAWACPEICEHFRMADVERVHIFVGEDRLEWSYIDGETDPGKWNYIGPLPATIPPFPGDPPHRQYSSEAK